MTKIPIAGPWITSKEIAYVADAVTNAWFSDANIYHRRFESAFARYVGRAHAIALPSCTSGLHLALLGLGVGPGDEVIVPEITWIASAAPITYVGATPIFADIEPDSWCLSADSFRSRITPKTKAVIVVDLYGNMPNMRDILEIAKVNRVAVIEDAAQAIGATYGGRCAGSFGIASVFSFHGSKTLTTGEGGMLVTDDPNLWDRCQSLCDHGRSAEGRKFWNLEIAHKYKMSSMQAALGLAQLERIDELVNRKREIFSWYAEGLSDCPGITLNNEMPDVANSYWMVTLVLAPRHGLDKETIMAKLSDLGIDSRPFFYPLSSLPAYARSGSHSGSEAQNPIAYRISPYAINLPSGFNLTRDNVDFICAAVKQISS